MYVLPYNHTVCKGISLPRALILHDETDFNSGLLYNHIDYMGILLHRALILHERTNDFLPYNHTT